MPTAEYHLKSSAPLVNLTTENIRNFNNKHTKDGPLPDQSNPHYVGLDRCWEWIGAKDLKGYGRLRCGTRSTSAHRVSYFLKYGEPPDDAPCILHRCDNASCCNPDHLFAGSHVENMEDKTKKNRCNALSGENHYAKTNPKPRRIGESNGLAKLTTEKVVEIRRLHSEGSTYKKLAPIFGVSFGTIGQVVKRSVWKHVP